jgi:hypothetical protein
MPQRLTEKFYIVKESNFDRVLKENTAKGDSTPLFKAKEIPLSNALLENTTTGQSFSCLAVYTVEVSRRDIVNANGRVYTTLLWEKVIREQKHLWDGSVGLYDHPSDDSDGNPRDIFCVWHNLRLGPNQTVLADMYLIDDKDGQKCKAVLDAGGRVGLSSSGTGDLKYDNKTVDEDSYEIERVADWVMNPSQKVYAYARNKIGATTPGNPVTGNPVPVTSSTIVESTKENTTKLTEGIEVSNKLKESEDKRFRINVKLLLKEAEEIESLPTKLDEYDKIIEYCEGEECVKDLQESLKEKRKNLSETIRKLAETSSTLEADKKTAEDELLNEKSTNKELKEKLISERNKFVELSKKFEIASITLDEAKKYTKTLKDLYEVTRAERNGMIEASQYKELLKLAEAQEAQVEELQSQVKDLEKDLDSTSATAETQEKVITDKDKKLQELEEEKKTLEEKLQSLTKTIREYEEVGAELEEENETLATEVETLNEKVKTLEESMKKKETSLKESVSTPALSERAQEFKSRISFREATADSNSSEITKIREYYSDLLKKNPKVAKIKEQILKEKTLKEAVATYTSLRPLIESVEEFGKAVTGKPEVNVPDAGQETEDDDFYGEPKEKDFYEGDIEEAPLNESKFVKVGKTSNGSFLGSYLEQRGWD